MSESAGKRAWEDAGRIEKLKAQLAEARAERDALQESEAMYQQEKKHHAQTRRDLDQKDHEIAATRAKIEEQGAAWLHLWNQKEELRAEAERLHSLAGSLDAQLAQLRNDYADLKGANALVIGDNGILKAEVERLRCFQHEDREACPTWDDGCQCNADQVTEQYKRANEAEAKLKAVVEALRMALDVMTDAQQYHTRRCLKDEPHDHALKRKLEATIPVCDAALAVNVKEQQ